MKLLHRLFGKKEEEELDEVKKIFKSLKLLESVGLEVRDLYATNEFIAKARINRDEIDKVGNSPELLEMNTSFACWVDKKEIRKELLKKKGIDLEGMMFGINFRRR